MSIMAIRHSWPAGGRKLRAIAQHGRRPVGDMGIAAGEREATDDGHAAGREHVGLGETHALAIAVEAACDADPLGVVAPEARMDAVHLLEPVDQTCLAEAAR